LILLKILVEVAGIEPALKSIKSMGCVSMLAQCCYFFKKNMQAFYRRRGPRESAGKGKVEKGLLESRTECTNPSAG